MQKGVAAYATPSPKRTAASAPERAASPGWFCSADTRTGIMKTRQGCRWLGGCSPGALLHWCSARRHLLAATRDIPEKARTEGSFVRVGTGVPPLLLCSWAWLGLISVAAASRLPLVPVAPSTCVLPFTSAQGFSPVNCEPWRLSDDGDRARGKAFYMYTYTYDAGDQGAGLVSGLRDSLQWLNGPSWARHGDRPRPCRGILLPRRGGALPP